MKLTLVILISSLPLEKFIKESILFLSYCVIELEQLRILARVKIDKKISNTFIKKDIVFIKTE